MKLFLVELEPIETPGSMRLPAPTKQDSSNTTLPTIESVALPVYL